MSWDGSGGSAITSENEQGRVFYFKRRKSNATAYLTNLLRLGLIAF